MLHPWRDANPFFHLIEALWMIAGRDDLKTLTRYVSTFGQFSDDGVTVPGAYGKRWRRWRAWPDQLDRAVEQLRANPRDRRVVIQMWDPGIDIQRNITGSKDVPCNISAIPFETEGKLNLTVFCRSNDMVLGAYGANAAHFSFLLCYLAARVGLDVGQYWQISVNFHAYVENAGDPNACWPVDWGPVDPYAMGAVLPYPLDNEFDLTDDRNETALQQDLLIFFEEGPWASSTAARWPFLRKIVVPMALAHWHWKKNKGEERFTGALEILGQMPPANDWRLAAVEWVERRYDRWQRADADGVQVNA
jgi:hypothetical protein